MVVARLGMNNMTAHVALHVRYIELQPGQEERVAPLLALLSAPEQGRADRFRFPAHRAAYIAAHALRVRMLQWNEECWSASAGAEHARPVTSLTHTDGLVACGLTRVAAIGVDAEAAKPGGDWSALADHVLTQQERAILEAHPMPQQWDQFLRYWTIKEAVSKALGVGLALPFKAVLLSLAPLQLLELPPGFGTCHGWHLEEHHLGSSHRMAAAVRHGIGGSVSIIWQATSLDDVLGKGTRPDQVPWCRV
jgi:4'-phosphopantetheinyl transferase